MLRGLDETLDGTDAVISRPEGGFFIWIRLPTGTDTKRLAELAAEARVAVHAGTRVLAATAAARSSSVWRSATSRRRSATRGPG